MTFEEKKKKNEAVDLDTALSIAGLGKFHIKLALVTGVCVAANATDNLGIGFVLSDVECELKLSIADKGLFSAATFLGMVLTGYAWGFASDIFGRRTSLLLSMAISWVSSFCASLAPVFWLLVTLRFLSGAAYAGMSSTIYAYMTEFLPPKHRTKFVSCAGTFIGLSYCFVPVAAWLTLPLTSSFDLGFVVIRSWRIVCIVNGSYVLVSFLGMLELPESPKYLVSIGKHDEAIDVLRRVFSINTGRPVNEYLVDKIKNTAEDVRTVGIEANDKLSFSIIWKTMKNQIAPIFGPKHLYTTILACILQFCILSGSSGLYLWMPDILNRMMNYNNANPNITATVCHALNIQLPRVSNTTCQREINSTVYMASFIQGVNFCASSLLFGLVVNSIGKRTLMASVQFVSGLAAYGLYLATDSTAIMIFMTTYMMQTGICFLPLSSMISDLYPTHLRSAALCIAMTAGRIGCSLVGTILGILLEYNCVATIFGFCGMSVGTGLLIFFVPKPVKTIEIVTSI